MATLVTGNHVCTAIDAQMEHKNSNTKGT